MHFKHKRHSQELVLCWCVIHAPYLTTPDVTGYALDSTTGAWAKQEKFTINERFKINMNWKLLTFVVCVYGFIKEYRPSEAYLSAYLAGPWKNLTVQEIDNEIYPIWTYAYLLWLIPVFLMTDYVRYQPMLVLEGNSLSFISKHT